MLNLSWLFLQFSPDQIEKKYGVGWAVAMIFGVVFLGLAILMGICFAIARVVHRRRKRRREVWGRQHGLELKDTFEMAKGFFNVGDTEVGKKMLAEYPYVSLFQKPLPMAMHILEGRVDGRPTRVFEFRYIQGSGRNTVECNFSVIAFEFESIKPYTAFRRHGWLDGLSKEDLQIGNEEFDKKFYVYADDWRLLPNEFSEDLRQMVLDSDLWDFTVADKTMVIAAAGRLKDKGYDQLFAEARRLANWMASKR